MDQVREHFENEAHEFDGLIRRLVPEYSRMLEALVAALPFDNSAELRVIDFGCGTGSVARAVIEAFPNASVTCVDVAENMITMARFKLGHHARAEFAHCDFEEFEFEGQYDAILSSLALHHLPDEDKRRFYRRIYDNLGAGGVFYNADIILASSDFLQSVYLQKWIAFMRREVADDEIECKWIPKYRAEDRPARLTDQLGWLAEIGFLDVDVLWKYYNFAVYGGRRQR